MRPRLKPCSVCVPAALVLLAGSQLRADDWEMCNGGNPSRNGQSAETGPSAPTVLWMGGVRPAIIAQEGVTGGDLLVVPRWSDFVSGGLIVGLELNTGAERWTASLPVTTAGAGNNRPTGFRDGQVYCTRSGNDMVEYLYALSPTNGSVIWRSADLITESYTESVAFADNGDIIASKWVISTGSNELLRIRNTDGTIAWRSPRSVPSSDGLGATVFGDHIYIWEQTVQGPEITAFDATTGTRLYSTGSVSGGLVQQGLIMVGPDGTVYAPRFQNNAATDFFVAYTDTGSAFTERWRRPIGYVPFGTYSIGRDGSVYTYDTTPPQNNTTMLTIRRRDPATGDETGASNPIPCDFPADPRMAIDAAGTLYLTNGSFGNGLLLSLNPDLSERWRFPVPNVNTSGPVIGQNGTLVVCGVGSNVTAFRTAAPCYANCDQSTTQPVLNVNDFICFQSRFAAGDSYANCDQSTTPPVLNVNDFVCFQTRFAAGCP